MANSKFPVIVQICSLILAVAGLAFGLFAIYDIVTPSPSGEWHAITLFAVSVVDIPLGLLSLLIGIFVKSGSRRLRRLTIILSIILLVIPILVNVLYANRIHFSP